MALGDLFAKMFGGDKGYDLAELTRRLDMSEADLRAVPVSYENFTIAKASGGRRGISAPCPELKSLQRRILRRLLGRLKCHWACTGFERRHSIVTNALPHVGQAIVVRMDIRNFFTATSKKRILAYFRRIGWNREAAKMLATWCAWKGGLPQGAPTSPRLSNLLNAQLDARLAGIARKHGASYTRYADDMTFSFPTDDGSAARGVIASTKNVIAQYGYKLHQGKKLRIRRRHARQLVTGLVVNTRVNLPRSTRRRLRAVEHRLAQGREATLTAEQVAGWRSLQRMVEQQGRQAG